MNPDIVYAEGEIRLVGAGGAYAISLNEIPGLRTWLVKVRIPVPDYILNPPTVEGETR